MRRPLLLPSPADVPIPRSPHHRDIKPMALCEQSPPSSPVDGFYYPSPSVEETNWSPGRHLCASPPPPRGGCIFFFRITGDTLEQQHTSVHRGWISTTSPLVRHLLWIGGCGLAGASPRRRQRAVPPKPCADGVSNTMLFIIGIRLRGEGGDDPLPFARKRPWYLLLLPLLPPLTES